jgi:acetyl-CoA acetyltransferase
MNVSLLGTGMTAFGSRPDDLRPLSTEAVAAALADAGITSADGHMVVFGNAVDGVLHGQEMIRGEVVLRHVGLQGVPMINVENACASSSSAFSVACMAVESGGADVVLVVGAERLTHRVKPRSFAALATAVDLNQHEDLAAMVGATGAREGIEPRSRSPLMDLYAAKSKEFMSQSGVTVEDAAAVSVKNRLHAATNPKAQFRRPVARAAQAAYGQAGIGPDDIDVVEVHDACAPAELWMYEELGLCDPGESSRLIRSGATQLGGRVPVNTCGGLIARGHPLGATGCAQLVELADQLRGRAGDRQVPGARVALAQNSGGILDRGDEAVAAVTILSRDS